MDTLGDCKWKVTYRGRNYDLSPLLRESLLRPMESDIRYALNRVPASAEHLEKMTANLRSARTKTIFGSVAAGLFVVAWIIHGNKSITGDVHTVANRSMYATGAIALTSGILSWIDTHSAKKELVSAVQEFNNHSNFKMEPASTGLNTPE